MQTKFLNREAFPIVTGTKSVKINAQKPKKRKRKITMMIRWGK